MERRIRSWVVCLAALAVFLGKGPVLRGDQPRATNIRLKATFIQGGITLDGNYITNKITNDTADYYVSNLSNFIVLRNDLKSDRVGGGFFVLDIEDPHAPYFSIGFPYFVKVTAYWDGTGRAARWIITPVNENFWVHTGDQDGTPVYDKYPDGMILTSVFYFSIRSCHYGRYYFPWELEISREN
jgi:hypothetical protein